MAPSDTQSTTSLASDKSIRPFLAPSFDPASYLNSVLPAWSPSTTQKPSSTSTSSDTVTLTDLNTRTQSLLSQLNAQLLRLSSTLTKLTDDILRSGSRLGYEVELLRGDTASLSESLTQGLRDDISMFVPHNALVRRVSQHRRGMHSRSNTLTTPVSAITPSGEGFDATSVTGSEAAGDAPPFPEHLRKLRILSTVRDRLDAVVKVFGAATEWVVPPSDVSIKSSFISVSAPDSGGGGESVEVREAKGKEYAEKVRREILELVRAGDGFGGAEDNGVRRALEKIEGLRELAGVWKGTSEEKARTKYVDGLVRLVEEQKR